jgi:hypothetical protein
VSWSDEQWDVFCALMQAGWSGDFTQSERKASRVLLDGVAPADAVSALKRLLHSGRTFYPRPAVSELLAELRADPSVPSFDEMLRLVYRAASRDDRMAWLGEHSPLVAAFVRVQGPDRLFTLQLDDPEWGDQRRRELREAWDNFLATAERREVAAIAAGRPDGLRQLDPLAGLDIAPPAALPAAQDPQS